MRKIFPLLFTAALLLFAACEEEETVDPEYDNWASRNYTAFAQKLNEAKGAINSAKQEHGENWEAHCNWRVYRLYSYQNEEYFESSDTVCVQILERGSGTASPIYSDSVKINYIGRLMPTNKYPEGRIFDHSGAFNEEADVFHPDFSQPVGFVAGNLVAGLTTALMQMHTGDKWNIYIHPNLGYAGSEQTGIPAYSALFFTVQLKEISRFGERIE